MAGPMVRDGPGALHSALRLAKQAVSGAIQTYSTGTSIKDAQIPIVEPSAVGLYRLGQLGTEVLPFSHRLYIPAMEEAGKKFDRNRAEVQRRLGISEPENMLEVGAEMLPNFIIPGRAPATAAQKVAATAAKKSLPRVIAEGAGKTAVELAIPLRQGGAKTVAAVTGLGMGLSEGADALDNDPNYRGLADALKPERAIMQPELVKEWVDYLAPETVEIYNQALQTGDQDTIDEIMEGAYEMQQNDKIAALEPPKPDWETEKAQAAALVVAAIGAGLGVRALNKVKSRLLTSSALTGQGQADNYTDAATKVVQGLAQHDQAARVATEEMTGGKFFGRNSAQRLWEAKFDAVSSPSLNSKFNHFANTGEIKGANTVAEPVGPLLSSIAKDLTPDERALLSDGLLASTSLDDRLRTGVATSFKSHRDGHQIDDVELTQIADAVKNSPKLAGYAQAIKDQYRKMLDLRLEKGMISKDQYDAFVDARPNFVHMSKNEAESFMNGFLRNDATSVPSDARKGTLWARSTQEGGGVTGGEAADPIVELTSHWAKTLREVAVHDTKKEWLELAANHPELSKVVRMLPVGKSADSLDGAKVHTVYENGMPRHYYIKDKALAEALDFSPQVAKGALSAVISLPKRIFEFGTTGAGNPFFAPTAMMYDTVAGIINRPKNYELGVLNEFMRKASKGKVGVGGFDPTMWVSAPIGAVRLLADQLTEAMAKNLAQQLQFSTGPVYEALGPQATKALETRLAAAYQASVKASMEKYGAANSSIFTAGEVSQLSPGLVKIAPEFATDAALQAVRDAWNGDAKMAQKVLATSAKLGEAGIVALRSTSIAQAYTSLLRSMHEGFRYQAFATNLPRVIGDEDAMQIMASQTRRISGDMAQSGSGPPLVQGVRNSAIYANAGVQGLTQFARMMKENPVVFTANLAQVMLSTGAFFLGYASLSQENRDKIRAMSDDDLARMVPTFGGLHVPIEPTMRPVIGPYIAVLKDISGMNSVNEDGTDNFDPNIQSMAFRLLENGLTEEAAFSAASARDQGLKGLLPVNEASFPLANAIAAGVSNIDLSFTRYTNDGTPRDPQGVRMQEVSPMGGEGKLIGDAMSARWQKVLENTVGGHIAGYARAAFDAERAVEGGSGSDKAFEVAMSRIVDNWAKTKPAGAMIFQNHTIAQSPNTTEFKLFYKKKEGYEQAIEIMNKIILTPNTTSKDPATAMLSQLDEFDILQNQELAGTQLGIIGGTAVSLQKYVRKSDLDRYINGLKTQIEEVQNQRNTTIEERNEKINELNEERLKAISQWNDMLQLGEQSIRENIGDPTFTWQAFAKDPDRYKQPVPPQPPAELPTPPP